MFPLFYLHMPSRTAQFQRPVSKDSKDYLPVFSYNGSYAVQVSNEEYKELEDREWVVKTYRQMLFLDQCYWV